MTDLYSIDNVVASCLACGAYTLTRKPSDIEHYSICGSVCEIEKWDRYYNNTDLEEEEAVEFTVEGVLR